MVPPLAFFLSTYKAHHFYLAHMHHNFFSKITALPCNALSAVDIHIQYMHFKMINQSGPVLHTLKFHLIMASTIHIAKFRLLRELIKILLCTMDHLSLTIKEITNCYTC